MSHIRFATRRQRRRREGKLRQRRTKLDRRRVVGNFRTTNERLRHLSGVLPLQPEEPLGRTQSALDGDLRVAYFSADHPFPSEQKAEYFQVVSMEHPRAVPFSHMYAIAEAFFTANKISESLPSNIDRYSQLFVT